MSERIVNDFTVLFRTKLDEKSKQEIGKNIKSLLENAAISFDETETQRNLEPIIRMMKKLFDKAEIAFDADQLLAMPSRQALQKLAEMEVDQLQMAFDKALAKSGGIKIDFGDMDFSEMIEPLRALDKEVSRIADRIANTTKKSVQEIERSLKSLNGINDKRIRQKAEVSSVESTLAEVDNSKKITPAKAIPTLEHARDVYAKSVAEDNPWVVQYQYLLEFVSKYERLTQQAQARIKEQAPELQQLYEQLAPKSGAVKISLEHYVDVAHGNELTEYKNQPWAREKTLQKIEQSLRSGITVKGGHGDERGNGETDGHQTPPWESADDEPKKPRTTVPIQSGVDVQAEEDALVVAEKRAQAEAEAARYAEKRRIEEERVAEAARIAAEAAAKKKKELKVYRGIIPPEDDDGGMTRRQILESADGAEWWTNRKGVAQTYADQDVGGAVLVGTISPKNPLVIDAGRHNFDEFAKMPGILANLEKFPDLMDKINSGEDINDIQRYVNETARALGYDVIEFANVNDVMNPDEFVQLGSSYAILNDSILSVSGAFAQLAYDIEVGFGEYAKKSSKGSIPDYYLAPEDEQQPTPTTTVDDSLTEQTTLLEKIKQLTTYIDEKYLSAGKHLSDFLDDVQAESSELDGDLKAILTTLNLIDDKGNLTFDIKRNGEEGGGTTHNGALISDDFVLIERSSYESVANSRLPGATQDAARTGMNIAEVLGYVPSKHTGGFFDVQSTARGHNLFENGVLSQDVVNATEEQLEQLIQAFIKARDYGFNIENGGSNVVYDREKGFSFYDLEELSGEDAEFWNGLSESEKKLYAIEDLFSLFAGLNRDHTNFSEDPNAKGFAERIKSLIAGRGLVDSSAVDATGRNYEDIYDDVFSGNVDAEYDDIIAMLQAEADAHRDNAAAIQEEVQAEGQLSSARADTVAASQEVGRALSTETPQVVGSTDTKPYVDSDESRFAATDSLRQLLESITYSVKTTQGTESAENNKVSIDESVLEGVLNRITYSVKFAQDADGILRGDNNAIDAEALKVILGSITYNVKHVMDTSERNNDKLSVDEVALEAVLNKVFASILNPEAKQDGTESKGEPWALESTLNTTIKGILDNIQNNTSKIGTTDTTNVDPIAGTTLDTRLTEIKSVLDAINGKIVQGTKVSVPPAGAPKSPGATTSDDPLFKAKVDTRFSELSLLYTKLESNGKMTDEIRQKYELLWQDLDKVGDKGSLSLWQQELMKVKNEIQEILIKNGLLASKGKATFQELIGITRLYNQMVTGAAKSPNQELQAFYTDEANRLLQEQSRILNEIDLTEEQRTKYGELQAARQRELARIQAQAAGAAHAEQERKIAKELGQAYDRVGQLTAQISVASGKEKEELERQLAAVRALIEEKKKELQIDEAEYEARSKAAEIKERDKIALQGARREDRVTAQDERKQALVGKAGNAIGRADNVRLELLGLDEQVISADHRVEFERYFGLLDELKKKHSEIQNSQGPIKKEDKQALIEQTVAVGTLTDKMSGLIAEYQRLSGSNVDETKTMTTTLTQSSGIGEYEEQLKQYVRSITDGKGQIKSFNAETKTLTYTVKTGKNEFTEYTAAVRHLDRQMVSVQGTTKRTETFFEATARKMKELTSYFSGMAIFSRIGQEIRRGIQYIREIDLALTELKKVTDETEETYDRFLDTAAKTGARLGSTISAVTEATATFAKLGYTMEQAAKMAESAIVYKNVGDNIASTEDAANSIISTMKGFKLEATESMKIVDRFNEVGNRFAITSQGIGEALRLSASALSEGGNSLDESIGLITAANEVVNDPSSVGTALKTLTLRLRGSKTELEEMGEDVSDMAETTSQLQAKLLALTGGQVDIMLDANTFKNSTEILREMAEAWADMNDIQRASALELMGGKRQANVLSALIQNFETVEEVIETSANSAGSALKENEKYLDSIQGKIDQFNNSLQTMWSNTLNSDWIKGFVEFGNKLIDIVDDVGLVKIALMGVGAYLTKDFDWLGGLEQSEETLEQMRSKLATLKADMDNAVARDVRKKTKKSHQKAEEATKRHDSYATLVSEREKLEVEEALNKKARERIDLQKQLDAATEKYEKGLEILAGQDSDGTMAADAFAEMSQLDKQIQQNGMSIEDANKRMQSLNETVVRTSQSGTTGFKNMTNGLKAFGKQVAGILMQMAAMYAITTLLELGGKFIGYIGEKIEENSDSYEAAKDNFDDLNNELADTKAELRSLESELDDTNDRIEELLSQDSLTLVEQDELKKLRSSTSELERQIELTKELHKLQQTSVNTASLDAMGKYTTGTSFYSEKSKTERQEEAEETGKTIGNVAGMVLGAAGAAIVGYFTGGTMTAQGYMAGAGIGSFLGGTLGGLFGSSFEGSDYDSEMTVEEALDRMASDTKKFRDAERAAHEAYATSNSKEDKQRWIEASQALNDYQNNLATSISQIQAYINSIDYSALTDPSEKQEYLDALDDTLAYAIIQGVQGAERLAIESIFSEKLITEDAQALMDAITSALESGADVDFMDFDDEKFDAIKQRLAGVGLTVTDLIYHFADLKEKADASLLIEPKDMVSSISKLSSSVGELKSAFDEFNESGIVTAETMMKLSETFGELDGWKDYIDLMSSGTVSMKEAKDATSALVEELFDKLVDNPFQLGEDDPTTEVNEMIEAQKSYWTTIAQLQSIGVSNAKELVDAMQQKAVVKAITSEIDAYDKLLERRNAGEKLTDEENARLSVTREDFKEQLIEEYKTRYGLNQLSAENLALIDEQIDKQMELSEQSEKIAKLDKLKGEFFTSDNNLLKQFRESGELINRDALEEFKDSLDPGDDVVEKYAKIREEYSALDEAVRAAKSAGYHKDHPLLDSFLDWSWDDVSWDAIGDGFVETITLGIADTKLDHYYDDLVNARNEKLKELYGVSDEVIEEVKNRQDLFKQLTDIASEYEIDLSGIDLTAFDATDTSDDGVFKQVYNTVYKALYGENGDGGLMAEWKATEEQIKKDLGTAFDAIGLEVTLELQDKDKLVDEIQSVYDELLNAQKEYSENGYISVDTMQSLLKLEPKYLDLLVDENGNLNLTKENLHAVARARIIDLGLKQQSAIVDQALALATNGSKAALDEWIIVNETADESMQDSISTTKQFILAALKAREATGELAPGYADNFMGILENQLTAVQRVTDLALSDLNNTLSQAGNTATQEANDAFKDAMDYWENRIGAKESQLEQVQNEIDMLEATGKKAGAGYFAEQLDLLAGDGGKLSLLNQQLGEAQAALAQVPEGSEDWWTIANTINDIHNEIDQTTMAVQDLKDVMADTHWYMFDEAHDRVSTLTSDLENIRDILSHEEFFDDEGNFTKEGLGYLATYVNDLGVFEGALAHAKTELDLFRNANGELSYDPNKQYVDAFGNDLSIDSEQDFYDAVEKAEGVYDDWNSKVIETRYNIKDLYEQQINAIEEYTQTLVENYNEYTDAVKEALDSERDLYEFKKSTEQKSKNIAAIERRIASLSGSTNAADVAERRKLQAELTDAKSDMDDHYYSHAKEQQSQALDEEATAYEAAMNAFIESLYTKLEEGTAELYMSYDEMGTETKSFIDGVTESVILNAGNVKDTYIATGETIDDSLMTPWVNAAAAIGTFSSSDGALGLMNSWTEAKAGAPFYDFQTKVSGYLSKPWSSIIGVGGPVQTFKTSVTSIMSQIVSSVNTNVSGISGYISGLKTEIDKIKDTTIRITTVYEQRGNGGGYDAGGGRWYSYQDAKDAGFSNILGASYDEQRRAAQNYGSYQNYLDEMYKKYMGKVPTYAKGTMGTARDGFAITDESWIGEEITLAAGKNGQLQYLKKGSAVMPADISANLVEWGKIDPSILNAGVTPNINIISNAINKPEIIIDMENFLRVDRVDQDTLPKLEAMMDKKIDTFAKQLNYSIKKFSR